MHHNYNTNFVDMSFRVFLIFQIFDLTKVVIFSAWGKKKKNNKSTLNKNTIYAKKIQGFFSRKNPLKLITLGLPKA
jgi:hypothetical protein